MAARSSTSSSDAPAADADDRALAVVRAAAGRKPFPRALVLAVAMLILVELWLRNSGWPRTLPYETGRIEYFVAAEQIERAGAAEISIVGSSRARESIIVPQMRQQLSMQLGRPVSVASYALSAAYASDMEAVVRRLLRATPAPRVILLGISERDLINAGGMWDDVARFHNVDDLRETWRERGRAVLRDMPVVIRSAVGRRWRTLGLREFLSLKIVRLCTGDTSPDVPSPAEGGLTEWQRISPRRNLVRRPVTGGTVLARAAQYTPEMLPYPELGDSLADLMIACKEARVTLILYEIHISRELREALPPGFYSLFTDYVTGLAKEHGHRFVRLGPDLKLKLANADMREPSHMSYRGAERLTQAMVERVLIPTLNPPNPANRKKRRPSGRPPESPPPLTTPSPPA